jgi:hypothetical protein
MRRSLLALLCFLCVTPQPSQAQDATSGEAVVLPEHRDAVVHRLAQVLRDYYHDATVGRKYHDQLLRNLNAGRYQVTSASNLAQRLTSDIQSVQSDGHLRVEFDKSAPKEPAPPLPQPKPGPHPVERPKTFEYSKDLLADMKANNLGIRGVRILPGNIGVLDLAYFSYFTEDVPGRYAAAFELLRHTEALVIDLTSNTGGDEQTVAYVMSHLLERKPFLIKTMYRRGQSTLEYWSLDHVDGPRYGESRPLFVATSAQTVSSGESFVYELKNLKRAVVVGEKTKGAANPGRSGPIGYGYSVFVPTGRVESAVTRTNWEGAGISPDVAAQADKAVAAAHKLALEAVIRNPSLPSAKARAERALASLPK